MRKLPILSVLFLLVFAVFGASYALAAASLDFPNGKVVVSSEPKSKTLTTLPFIIRNNGDTALTEVSIQSLNFLDSNGKPFTITGSVAQSSLGLGATTTGTLTVTIPSDVDLEILDKTVNVVATNVNNTNNTITVPLSVEIRIEPESCQSDPDKTEITNIDVKDPDSGDDFEVGDTISVRAEVSNHDTKDRDYKIKVILYDVTTNKKIESEESDEVNINDGDSETLEVDLKIPTDEDIDDDDEYVLFIEAYQSGKRTSTCNSESIDINIKVPSHKVAIEDSSLSPSQVNCGDSVIATVNTRNVGSSTERNVRIRAREPTMNINVLSDPFELERMGKSNDLASKSVTIPIPGDAKPGQYTFELFAEPGTANKVSEFQTLQVSCEAPVSKAVLELPSFSIKATQGSLLDIPVTITNNADSEKTFTVEATAVGNFASADTKTITLAANEEGTLTLSMNVDPNSDTGSKIVLIAVKEGSNVVASKSAPVLIESKSAPITGSVTAGNLFGNTKNAAVFFVIADVLLVLIALYILVLIFRRRKKE